MKKRLNTAGHGSRKRSAVSTLHKNNRPITAKIPTIGRRHYRGEGQVEGENKDGLRPETVPFTNIGPLGETEPVDENDRIKQEITREVTGESEKEIEARIGDEEEKEESEEEPKVSRDKFNEREKQMDNLTDDLSANNDHNQESNHSKSKKSSENNEEKGQEDNESDKYIQPPKENEENTNLEKIVEKHPTESSEELKRDDSSNEDSAPEVNHEKESYRHKDSDSN